MLNFIVFLTLIVLDTESEALSKSMPAEIPNNISKYSGGAKPLAPSQVKCNILKGKRVRGYNFV